LKLLTTLSKTYKAKKSSIFKIRASLGSPFFQKKNLF
jgi:hypothetical protein